MITLATLMEACVEGQIHRVTLRELYHGLGSVIRSAHPVSMVPGMTAVAYLRLMQVVVDGAAIQINLRVTGVLSAVV